jgi:ribosomal protein S27AE
MVREICPECGSADIVSDLVVFSDDSLAGQQPPYVQLLKPKPEKAPFMWSPKHVDAGFHAAVCGACGFTRFYTKRHAEILDASRRGYTSKRYDRETPGV